MWGDSLPSGTWARRGSGIRERSARFYDQMLEPWQISWLQRFLHPHLRSHLHKRSENASFQVGTPQDPAAPPPSPPASHPRPPASDPLRQHHASTSQDTRGGRCGKRPGMFRHGSAWPRGVGRGLRGRERPPHVLKSTAGGVLQENRKVHYQKKTCLYI